jgi:hypothetical protein
MRKGGVHEKSATTKRRQVRSKIDAALDDWREAVEVEREVSVPTQK